jgi:amidophosphoribosyltransferase
MLYIDKNQQQILKKLYSAKISRCIFQIAYFAEVESILDGLPVYQSRLAMGQALACILKSKYPDIKMDSSIAVPESSNPIAEGFAEEYDIPNRQGIRRRRHIDRSFIDSDPSRVLDEKFGIIASELNGKNIVLIEDSIVRGNTLGKKLIKKIKAESSPASIHVCIGFPPVQAPCFYGIDMSTLGQLMVTDYQKQYGNIYTANNELDPHFEKWCAEKLEVDSVTFLTTDRYLKAIGIKKDESCTACCTAEYPTPCGKQKYDELAKKFYDK